jgi:hypothetical protein
MCTGCKQSDFAAKQPAIVEQVDRRKVRERTNERMYVSMARSPGECCVATEEGAATRWRLRP